MKKVIWLIGNEKKDMIVAQRQVNITGSMRAICMLSFDAVKKAIGESDFQNRSSLSFPSLIVLDYEMSVTENFQTYSLLKVQQCIAGVPLFFMTNHRTEGTDEECYSKGAMVVVIKPFSNSAILRMERTAWQYEVSRNYEQMLLHQASDLQEAREIARLNEQLKKRNDFLHQIFGRYFSDEVVNLLLEHPENASIGGERRQVAVMMADLRGFTSISEEMAPEDLMKLLNHFFEQMELPIQKYHGTIIELLGDCILAVFGAPLSSRDYIKDAVSAAICMQNNMQTVNEYGKNNGYPELEIGIGIHAGEAFIGNIGSKQMMRYNVLGEVVNECSRIETCSVGGQVLVSEETIEAAGCEFDIAGMQRIKVKGVQKPLMICDVTGVKDDEEISLHSYQLDDLESLRQTFYVHMKVIVGKQIKEEKIDGRLLAWSRQSLLVFFTRDVAIKRYENVELSIEFPGLLVENIYAKIMEYEDNSMRLRMTFIPQDKKKRMWEILEKSSSILQKEKEKEYGTDHATGVDAMMNYEQYKKYDFEPYDISKDFPYQVNQCYRWAEEEFYLMELQDEQVESLFAEMTDMIEHSSQELEQYRRISEKLYEETHLNYLLMYWKCNEEYHLAFLSRSCKVRALEFLDGAFSRFGLVRGTTKYSIGIVSEAILKVEMSLLDMTDVTEYLMRKANAYFNELEWIFADEYAVKHENDILQLPLYHKKKITWAYVRTMDIAREGEQFRLRTLENEAGLILSASPDIYIMIGCKGEVYDIHRDKFERTYEETDETLDIFDKMLEFIPEVQMLQSEEYVSIDEMAKLCVPKQNGGIYVKQLQNRCKVFQKGQEDYFLGRKGDYMVIRQDDLSDIYIIQQDVFEQTYEKVE